MQVSVIEPGELHESQIAAWRAMQEAQPHLRNPFLAPDFCIAGGRVLGSARVAVVTDDDPAER